MIASPPLAWALTAVFVLTGGYALLRCAATVAGALPSDRRPAELAHLMMSVSMVVMLWSWFGTAGLVVQVVLFGVFTAYFAVRAVRSLQGAAHGCHGGAAHALMAASMVWMLVAMPSLMAVPVPTADDGGGHAGHGGHGRTSAGDAMTAGGGGQSGWAVTVTLALCVALLVACGYWALRALRRDEVQAPVPEPVLVGAGPSSPVPRAASVPRALADRTDAGCHTAMSLGMVVMLVAMVAGW